MSHSVPIPNAVASSITEAAGIAGGTARGTKRVPKNGGQVVSPEPGSALSSVCIAPAVSGFPWV